MRLLLFIAILLLTSCKAIKEAREDRKERKVEEWNLLHPEKAATWCAEHYPCLGDSTHSTVYIPGNDSSYRATLDSLLRVIGSIDSGWIMLLDSATTETAEAYRSRVIQLQKQVASLKNSITELQKKPCKADTVKTETKITVIDSAANVSARLQVVRLNKELIETKADRDEWKVKARSRQWMFIAACALIVGLIAVIVAILKGKKQVNRIT